MDRRNWMYVRAYAPAAGLLLLALVVAVAFAGLHAGPMVAGLIGVAKLVPVALFAAGVLQPDESPIAWQAHNSVRLLCHCGGLLGAARESRADRGGAYRRCYAWGININHCHY